MKPRSSFTFTAQMDAIVCAVDDTEREEALLHAIIGYGLYKRTPSLPPSLDVVWNSTLKPILDRQWQLFLNGSQGGAPKGNQNASKQPKNNQKTTKKQPKNNQETTKKQPNIVVKDAECVVVTEDVKKQPDKEVVLGCFSSVKEKEDKENTPTPLKETEVKEITKKENINTKEKKSIEQRMADFRSTLMPYEPRYGREMLEAFYTYWSEPTKDGKRMRYELNKTWSVGGRLSTWFRNQSSRQSFSTPLKRKMMDDQVIDNQRANHLFNLMNNEQLNSNNDQPPV